MKRRIIIHVGMPRAGSSTLQEALLFHRTALEQSGIAYAALRKTGSSEAGPGFEYNHRPLNGAAKGFLRPQNGFHTMMKAIVEDVRNRPDHISVLSYEGWWDPRNLRPLQRVLKQLRQQLPDVDVELFAVVREPVAFLLSLYKLDVLHGRTQLSFEEHLPKALADPRLRYASIATALSGLAGKVTFLDFEAFTARGQFCGAVLKATTGVDLAANPALTAFCLHRSGGAAYFSDAIVSMVRFASGQLGVNTVQRHRQEIHDVLLRLSRDPRISQHSSALVVPLSSETAARIGTATRPLVQDFYTRHLPAANTRLATRHDGQAQSEIAKDSALGQEVLRALSVFSQERDPWWKFRRR